MGTWIDFDVPVGDDATVYQEAVRTGASDDEWELANLFPGVVERWSKAYDCYRLRALLVAGLNAARNPSDSLLDLLIT